MLFGRSVKHSGPRRKWATCDLEQFPSLAHEFSIEVTDPWKAKQLPSILMFYGGKEVGWVSVLTTCAPEVLAPPLSELTLNCLCFVGLVAWPFQRWRASRMLPRAGLWWTVASGSRR